METNALRSGRSDRVADVCWDWLVEPLFSFRILTCL